MGSNRKRNGIGIVAFETGKDIENRFDYHAPRDNSVMRAHGFIRENCKRLALQFNSDLPDSREKALAMTKLEEAMMWANAAIARNQ